MNQNITILFALQETNSGKIYIVEEKVQNKSTIKYFAYDFCNLQFNDRNLQPENKLKSISRYPHLFRSYQKLILGTPDLYLFEYMDGEFLDKKVLEKIQQKRSFEYAEILFYLKQLLQALYELHKQNILGRVFSLSNIFQQDQSQNIVLMEFGFNSNIKQNFLDILAPPEYLQSLIKNEQNFAYDEKFDSWLVGAFLYNLIKLRPINHYLVEDLGQQRLEKFKYDRLEIFYDRIKNLKYIPCQTSRYDQALCSFVQRLLTCNKDERLSFYEIYKDEFVQNIQFQDPKQQYLDFYEKFKNKYYQSGESIFDTYNMGGKITEDLTQTEPIFKTTTSDIQSQYSVQNQQQPETPKTTKFKILEIPNYYDVIMKQPKFTNESYKDFWTKIQLEYLRCYILLQTGELIIQKKINICYIYGYFIKKMHYIILTELSSLFRQKSCQIGDEKQWESFLNEYQNQLIQPIIIDQYLIELSTEMKSIFQTHCKSYLNENSKLPELVKQSLKDDEALNHNIKDKSNDFLLLGYSDVIEMLLAELSAMITKDEKSQELKLIKKLAYLCQTIDISFRPESFQEQFRNLIKENRQILPGDLINFLNLQKKNE